MTQSTRAALLTGLLAVGVSAQEFALPTPKGDVVVKIAQNSLTSCTSRMRGTITNTTGHVGWKPVSVPAGLSQYSSVAENCWKLSGCVCVVSGG
jgi:hypothetical protein